MPWPPLHASVAGVLRISSGRPGRPSHPQASCITGRADNDSYRPSDACLRGRVIVCLRPGWREPLYLFTTLDASAEDVVELYGLRWNIETDLKSLKQTVHLNRLRSRSMNLVEKELLAALAAYNLVRYCVWRPIRRDSIRDNSVSHACFTWSTRFFRACWTICRRIGRSASCIG